MEVIKVISQSMGGLCAEVIIQNDKGLLLTKHIQRHSGGWYHIISVFKLYKLRREKKDVLLLNLWTRNQIFDKYKITKIWYNIGTDV